jgi:hypothetical protein
MSIRAQKIRVTDDPQAKYVIRVSGNSLASLTLDFDGDVIYLMSFHSPESKRALVNEFNNPHPLRKEAYEAAASKHIPAFKSMGLDDYKIEIFTAMTADRNASIVNGLTGIKRGTGTIIALCYNIMRIVEREIGYDNLENMIGIELLLDKVANSVFSRKHAGRSLENECREAICCADVDKMVSLGMNEKASALLADIVVKKALELGVTSNNLRSAFDRIKSGSGSSIINRIIRKNHKHWFTSRSNLHPLDVLTNLDASPEDLTGWMFERSRKTNNNLTLGDTSWKKTQKDTSPSSPSTTRDLP